MADVDALVAGIASRLESLGDPERAEGERRYLKSQLQHFGVRLPLIRSTVKEALRGLDQPDADDLEDLVDALWRPPIHEMRTAAVEVVTARVDQMPVEAIASIERMLRESDTWALVDPLAIHGAGRLLRRHPDQDAILDRWAGDTDFWIRRSALLAHLTELRHGAGDWDRFTRYADAMLDEKEFFIRKAIGWILRDTARKRPDMVYEWMLPRADRASGVTVREAVKPLSPDQAEQVMERYRSTR